MDCILILMNHDDAQVDFEGKQYPAKTLVATGQVMTTMISTLTSSLFLLLVLIAQTASCIILCRSPPQRLELTFVSGTREQGRNQMGQQLPQRCGDSNHADPGTPKICSSSDQGFALGSEYPLNILLYPMPNPASLPPTLR